MPSAVDETVEPDVTDPTAIPEAPSQLSFSTVVKDERLRPNSPETE
jgi:hypothetical protein